MKFVKRARVRQLKDKIKLKKKKKTEELSHVIKNKVYFRRTLVFFVLLLATAVKLALQ